MIQPAQIRAARAWLQLDRSELAKRADVPVAALQRLEDGETTAVSTEALERLQRALETAGIDFVEGGVKARRKRTQAEKDALFRELKAIALRAAARPVTNPDFGEKDLYDENGLPA